MMKGRVSISLRLTMWFGGIFLFGWMLFGTAMWLNLKSTLKNERRQTLARRLDRLQTLLSQDRNADRNADRKEDQKENEADRYQDFNDFAHATGNGLVEVFRADGTRAYPSPSAAASSFPWPAIHPKEAERFTHIESAGQPYWVLARSFPLGGEPLFLLAASPDAGSLVVLESFWKGLLASAPILLLISSAGGYWVSRRALKPVDRITATARSISIRNLSERLPAMETGDELQRLAETCNAMLNRLESAVNQIKQFTADASHELRGPLSFTRTVAEVALKNPHADEESRRAFEDIVDEASKAAVLLEEMLTLARADADPFDMVLEPVDLAAVIEDVCAAARPIADQRGLTLAVSNAAEPPVAVIGNFSSLRRLLWILLDNALKYTQSRGQIEVSFSVVFGRATLLVRDNGIGISAADLPHIFDRFFRADPSRALVEGNGLGLAIAKWIAETHHARLSVASEEGMGTTFQLVFPHSEA
jgi:heavy metal sensor kinase